MKKLLVNIDLDGVLIPNYFEKRLVEKLSGIKLTPKIHSFTPKVFEWYTDMVNTSPLPPVNVFLLDFFNKNKDKYVLRLWTNRNLELRGRTNKTLCDFKSVFDSFEFHYGNKLNSEVEGIVIDNDPKYLSCGELGGIHYVWKGVSDGN